MSAEQGTKTIVGREIQLASGAKVFGGRHEQSIVWKFTSTEGGITHLTLSREAMAAMVHVFQGLIGCDPDFVAIELESSAPTVGAKP